MRRAGRAKTCVLAKHKRKSGQKKQTSCDLPTRVKANDTNKLKLKFDALPTPDSRLLLPLVVRESVSKTATKLGTYEYVWAHRHPQSSKPFYLVAFFLVSPMTKAPLFKSSGITYKNANMTPLHLIKSFHVPWSLFKTCIVSWTGRVTLPT